MNEGLAFIEAAAAEAGPELATPGRVQLEGQLGRALFLTERREEARSTLERTIEAAERDGLLETLVEAIISLGSNNMYLGLSSGLAMLFGGRELAARSGFVTAEVRALNNLATWSQLADPTLERELQDRIVELCDRVGFDAINWIVAIPPHLLMTDGLDEAERIERDIVVRIRPGTLEESTLLVTQIMLRAQRGDATGFDAARARLAEAPERSEEARVQEIDVIAIGEALLGRIDAAEAMLATSADERLAVARLLVSLRRADRDGIDAAIAQLPQATVWDGPLGRGSRKIAVAATHLLDGVQADDVTSYLEGLSELRGSMRAAEWTLAGVALVRIVGLDRVDVREAIESMRTDVERIGAWGCVRLIDAAIAEAAAPQPTTSTATTRAPDAEHAPA